MHDGAWRRNRPSTRGVTRRTAEPLTRVEGGRHTAALRVLRGGPVPFRVPVTLLVFH